MKTILRGLILGVWAAVFITLLSACAGKPGSEIKPDSGPTLVERDETPQGPALLSEIVLAVPQRASLAVPVSDQPLMAPAEQAAMHNQALERFFAPWKQVRASLSAKDISWGVRGLGSKQGYAENLQPYPQDRWVHVVALQDLPTYPSLSAPAITVRNTAMRVLPSNRPFFLDPKRPGEGFPFDYFQNTAVWMGTPVFITHVSLDRAWYYVETAFANGWVRSEDVALTDANFCAQYESRAMVALRKDETSLVGQGMFLGQTHIGAIFPLHSRGGQGFMVKVPVRDATGRAKVALAELGYLQASRMPLPLTSRTVAELADAMSGQLYGWGGMFENRDCSSAMRDLFLPFGIWLPRNSSQQAKHGGEHLSLEGLDAAAKLNAIRTQGVPFASLVWLPGHIGLYLGTSDRNEPLMLHNLWGVRTVLPEGGEGRAVVGRLVISTLRPGEERDDVGRDDFLDKVRGLTLIGAKSSMIEK
ncbi:NlpC/P60 family protein [Desulfomicrobium apsheronum]|uniref:NlpC/P60 family protein n=1 Tax=Desulfomicrobium apsheronum TaxID=52560 RepID=A0A1I3R9J3_9BACT|nr:SH3 domain-containing protein [Desulfomicrobium apsheronum]SFJ42998.1 NlpC/P60 family protein [Desulfomicrobium apsheronum]